MASRREIDEAYEAHEAELATPKVAKQTPPLPVAVKLEREAASFERMLLAKAIRSAQRKQTINKAKSHKRRQ